jgi:hypothetical protein
MKSSSPLPPRFPLSFYNVLHDLFIIKANINVHEKDSTGRMFCYSIIKIDPLCVFFSRSEGVAYNFLFL